jgi:ribosome-associated protein
LKELTSRTLACIIARIMDDRLGKEIEVLNLTNISVISDYFVICSAASSTQVRSLSAYIAGTVKKEYGRTLRKEETDTKNRWHLLDYGDVVAHIMHQEERAYYALEKFWSHACKISTTEWMEETKELGIE